jgi:hypothetical protein
MHRFASQFCCIGLAAQSARRQPKIPRSLPPELEPEAFSADFARRKPCAAGARRRARLAARRFARFLRVENKKAGVKPAFP